MSPSSIKDIITDKRDGHALSYGQIKQFVDAVACDAASDAQIAALTMAICVNKMTAHERAELTFAMRDSGRVLLWPGLSGPVIDKHSTGGVGDNVSLILAPALAACGAYVPMISGRGLGHTGGTLDKLEAIEGYQIRPAIDHFQQVVKQVGCAIIGQSDDLAPADRRIYAVRDVTGTVESIDLITASILSKKLASGISALILDVKCGKGAFMPDLPAARALAQSIIDTSNIAGCACSALITAMDSPLANAAGNALEVRSAVDMLLAGQRDSSLYKVVCALGGKALERCGLAASPSDGEEYIAKTLSNGKAAEKFGKMVCGLGGPADFVERYKKLLPAAPYIKPVIAPAKGFVSAIDARAIANGVMSLKGGRQQVWDKIDPRVGISDMVAVGSQVEEGAPLALVHAANQEACISLAAQLGSAFTLLGSAPPKDQSEPILARLGDSLYSL